MTAHPVLAVIRKGGKAPASVYLWVGHAAQEDRSALKPVSAWTGRQVRTVPPSAPRSTIALVRFFRVSPLGVKTSVSPAQKEGLSGPDVTERNKMNA